LKPSISAHAHLAARLRDFGTSLETSDYPAVATLGQTYLKLYQECLDALLSRTQAEATNNPQAEFEELQDDDLH
jgi:hypothetical protein